ncbi:hypothetical protein N7448_006367 [Penicillium atrosanguineum]|uniref:Uncharacterized protein n=1 Tax=Penicillium atrosanguineum TaxID=1132637 RepID=A0A9W9GY58_9EURO|nr:uncharacterized protein N7443_010127 [Penicillium atrosanguineum]KAJ5132209.1 hypothetical protein N7448_006367 [Penicillium atrosanguineum]KAJ5137581.1 hypothetical protein N7526_003814 [Penicillium atrosanguineum]KAJ5289874.1 hypothetical protein N7443_010127 [Penicillium atrosanguineum]KAJ5307698.1 hypothetical protein N7476_008354 [Penicillium atrosanguineum]
MATAHTPDYGNFVLRSRASQTTRQPCDQWREMQLHLPIMPQSLIFKTETGGGYSSVGTDGGKYVESET